MYMTFFIERFWLQAPKSSGDNELGEFVRDWLLRRIYNPIFIVIIIIIVFKDQTNPLLLQLNPWKVRWILQIYADRITCFNQPWLELRKPNYVELIFIWMRNSRQVQYWRMYSLIEPHYLSFYIHNSFKLRLNVVRILIAQRDNHRKDNPFQLTVSGSCKLSDLWYKPTRDITPWDA